MRCDVSQRCRGLRFPARELGPCLVGVGTAMIHKLVSKLAAHRRNRIELVSSERDLHAHLFFRATGFIAAEVLPKWEDDENDAYLFRLRVAEEIAVE